jgi:UDP-N-acetyl-D-mannosaminuronic acid dehydrogenase
MGLPMAAILAKAGHTVLGVDINPAVVTAVNAGECPFHEPGMAELVTEAHASGNLKAFETPQPAEVYLLSLPTPVDHKTHQPDMRYVEAGAKSIAPVLQSGELVILESTSPIGATEANVKALIEAMRPELVGRVEYVFCPERAIPGNTLHEMVHNDRLVGGLTESATQRALEIYKTFCKGELLPCTTKEAEMVKLVENASRDAQIAFANELSIVCHTLGLDVWRVRELANHHPRVNVFLPATGVGGHCIAVDPWFIIHQAPNDTPLMKTVRHVNDGKPLWVVERVKEAIAQIASKKEKGAQVTIACLGLAYKPNVDDLRDSPSITVVEALSHLPNVHLKVVEPFLQQWKLQLSPLDEALSHADIVITLTAHDQFKQVPESALANKWLVDACGMYRGYKTIHNVI